MATVSPQQSIPTASTEVYGPQLPGSVHTFAPEEKTPVSALTELCMKMGLRPGFQTVSESGLSHNRTFIVECTVGDVSGKGTGNSKKKAKHEAAKTTLEKLKQSKIYHDYLQGWTTKSSQAPQNNAINHLQEVIVKRGLEAPVYELVDTTGATHMREFETRVTVGNKVASGKGRTKKESKRTAAEAMLSLFSTTNLSLEPPNKKIAFVSSGSVVQQGPIAFQPGGIL